MAQNQNAVQSGPLYQTSGPKGTRMTFYLLSEEPIPYHQGLKLAQANGLQLPSMDEAASLIADISSNGLLTQGPSLWKETVMRNPISTRTTVLFSHRYTRRSFKDSGLEKQAVGYAGEVPEDVQTAWGDYAAQHAEEHDRGQNVVLPLDSLLVQAFRAIFSRPFRLPTQAEWMRLATHENVAKSHYASKDIAQALMPRNVNLYNQTLVNEGKSTCSIASLGEDAVFGLGSEQVIIRPTRVGFDSYANIDHLVACSGFGSKGIVIGVAGSGRRQTHHNETVP
jgi:hypothetical protein